jgi:hypothetical protein
MLLLKFNPFYGAHTPIFLRYRSCYAAAFSIVILLATSCEAILSKFFDQSRCLDSPFTEKSTEILNHSSSATSLIVGSYSLICLSNLAIDFESQIASIPFLNLTSTTAVSG